MKTKRNVPYELLGYKRKLKSQRTMWNILYDIFDEYERNKSNNLESISLSQLEEKYWIQNETMWRYTPDRIKRKSIENNEKCVKLYPSDIENIKKIVDLFETMATLRIDEVNVIRFTTMYLLNLV